MTEREKSRFLYFFNRYPRASLKDYVALARVADGMPMTDLAELERAGQWLLEIVSFPDPALLARALQRWEKTCGRSLELGPAVSVLQGGYKKMMEGLHSKKLYCQ